MHLSQGFPTPNLKTFGCFNIYSYLEIYPPHFILLNLSFQYDPSRLSLFNLYLSFIISLNYC